MSRVGIIEPDGMEKVCTTKVRRSTATPTATTTTITSSRSQCDFFGGAARSGELTLRGGRQVVGGGGHVTAEGMRLADLRRHGDGLIRWRPRRR